MKSIKGNNTFVTDPIAAIRTRTNLPNTYKEFVWNFVSTLRRGLLDIVADSYRENSIKRGERSNRGSSQNVIIASCKSSLPRDFFVFMKNGENKNRLIGILSEILHDIFAKVLTTLCCSTMFISQKDVTYCLIESSVTMNEGRTIFKSWGGRQKSDSSLLPLNATGPVEKNCVAFTFRRYHYSCPGYSSLGF